MLAIRLTAKNRSKILNESPIDPRDLDALIDHYDRPLNRWQSVYFIPQFKDEELSRTSWVTLTRRRLADQYDFADHMIDYTFVEITRK